jgi:UvrD/REP helicase N-terminal domain
MTRVTLGKSRVRESRTPGSVRAKAEWLSYSTSTRMRSRLQSQRYNRGCAADEHVSNSTRSLRPSALRIQNWFGEVLNGSDHGHAPSRYRTHTLVSSPPPPMDCQPHLRDLNDAQRAAVEYGVSDGVGAGIAGPLLVIAGAGTGKSNTLAHRVAHLILDGHSARPHPPADIFSPRRRGDDQQGSAHLGYGEGYIKAESCRVRWRNRLVGHLPRNWQPLITRTRQQPRTRFLVHGSRSFRFGRPPQLRSQRSGLGGITSSITRSRGREAGSSSRREASRSNPRGRMAVAAARVEPAAAFAVAPREAGFRAAP